MGQPLRTLRDKATYPERPNWSTVAVVRKLFLIAAVSSSTLLAAPAPCEVSTLDRENRYEIGLSLQSLYPNGLPNDPANLPVYGPRFGIPFLGNKLYLQTLYGSADPESRGATTVILSEVGYQIPIELPFFVMFAEGGVHYLHYTKLGKSRDMFGGNLGTGLMLPMGKNFKLTLSLKAYLQERAIISLGGGFSILL